LDRVARSAEQINQGVLKAVGDRLENGRPFLLFINYMDAHVPYIPPSPFDQKFPGKDPAFTEARYISTYFDVMVHKRKIDAKTHAHLLSQYDAAIAYMDAQLALLFARLKELGVYDNSLIIITSDHGEAFGERHYMDHGGMSAYDDQILVPLLIKYPHTHDPAVVQQPASSVDLLPTILDTAGFPIPGDLPGHTLRATLAKDREVISESFPGGRAYYTNAAAFNRIHRTMISGSWKFIAGSAGRPELYNVRHDPGETKNLYNPRDPISLGLAERLRAWSRSVAQKSRSGVKLDSETLERLRSLGYVQ
jgi:arylsulfatase A-like enzyme